MSDEKRQKLQDEDSEEEWEEIEMNSTELKQIPTESVKQVPEVIEIEFKVQKKKYTRQDRYIRQLLHQCHVLALLAFSLKCYRCVYQFEMERPILHKDPLEKVQEALFKFKTIYSVDYEKYDLDFATNTLSPISFCVLFHTLTRSKHVRLVASFHPIPRTFRSIPTRTIQFWIEVFQNGEWIGFDPLLGVVKKECDAPYVVAIEGGWVKDVTRKYTCYWSQIEKQQTPEWWLRTISLYMKPTVTVQDELEEFQMCQAQVCEKMPNNLKGFLNHPLYALEKQLKQNQIIYPYDTKLSIGMYKKLHVFPRSLVKTLKTKNQWMQIGKSVPTDTEPIKTIPRELYGEWQTIPMERPTTIVRNQYGNIELFCDEMRPLGTTHLKVPGIAATAKKMGIEYVDVVVGFEYKRQKYPKIDGILVKDDVVDVLMQGHEVVLEWEREKKRKRNEGLVLGRWRKLVLGILLKDRLEKDYLS